MLIGFFPFWEKKGEKSVKKRVGKEVWEGSLERIELQQEKLRRPNALCWENGLVVLSCLVLVLVPALSCPIMSCLISVDVFVLSFVFVSMSSSFVLSFCLVLSYVIISCNEKRCVRGKTQMNMMHVNLTLTLNS